MDRQRAREVISIQARVGRLLRRNRVALALFAPLLVVAVLFGGGLLFGMVQSLGFFPAAGLEGWTLDNYIDVLTDRSFLGSLWLTFRIAFISTVLSTVVAVCVALVLRRTFLGSKLTTLLFQIPLSVPHLVAASGVVLLVSQSGILSRLGAGLGLIDRPADFPVLVFDHPGVGIILTFVWKEAPFIGLVALAVLRSIGAEYEEVARTLGASAWQRFLHVLMPMILPGVLSASVIVFAFTFASYEIPLLLGVRSPTTLPVLAFRQYQDPDLAMRPEAMAISIILAVVGFGLVLAYRRLARHLVR